MKVPIDPPQLARAGVHHLGTRLSQLPDPCLQFGLAGRGEQGAHQPGVEPRRRLDAEIPGREEDRSRESDQERLPEAVHGEETERFAEHPGGVTAQAG